MHAYRYQISCTIIYFLYMHVYWHTQTDLLLTSSLLCSRFSLVDPSISIIAPSSTMQIGMVSSLPYQALPSSVVDNQTTVFTQYKLQPTTTHMYTASSMVGQVFPQSISPIPPSPTNLAVIRPTIESSSTQDDGYSTSEVPITFYTDDDTTTQGEGLGRQWLSIDAGFCNQKLISIIYVETFLSWSYWWKWITFTLFKFLSCQRFNEML